MLSAFKADGGNQQGVTVTRIHLNLSVVSGVAAGDTFAWGLIRGQSSDVGLNIAGAPNPEADPYDDWLFWRTEIADSNGHYWPGGSNNHTFDIKAQRRLEELQMNLNFVVQRIGTGADLELAAVTSVLLKLP